MSAEQKWRDAKKARQKNDEEQKWRMQKQREKQNFGCRPVLPCDHFNQKS